MPGLRDQGAAIGRNWAFAFHRDMHLPATAIELSWEYQYAELRSVQQTTFVGEPLPYVSRRRKESRSPPQLPLALKPWGRDFGPQSFKQLLLNGRSAGMDYGDDESSSEESDDLASMVHDFIENDSGNLIDHNISDCGCPSTKLSENLLAFTTAAHGSLERELLTDVKMLVLTIKDDTDLICDSQGKECKGGCTKRFVVKHLKASGYNAAVCKSRWQSSSSVPGGEHEYIDVMSDNQEESGDESVERYIMDIDFQAHFEIARPTQQYEAALKALPTVFVGTSTKLNQVLEIMSDAAKASLKQNAMHLPPWRTLDYMSAKWFSNVERKSNNLVMSSVNRPCSSHWKDNRFEACSDAKPCVEQLQRIKFSLLSEMKGSALSNLPQGRSTRANLMLQGSIL